MKEIGGLSDVVLKGEKLYKKWAFFQRATDGNEVILKSFREEGSEMSI